LYKAKKNVNVARKIVSINHTGKWQIGKGLSLAGKNLLGFSIFLLPLQNVNQIICRNHGEHKFFYLILPKIFSL